jgi:hypothetical protein
VSRARIRVDSSPVRKHSGWEWSITFSKPADEKGIWIFKFHIDIENVNELLYLSLEHRDMELIDGGSDSEKPSVGSLR